jgi:hypothetical protein
MIPKIRTCVVNVDNGSAPCVFGEVLSLAICRPVIRHYDGIGDLIFGFGNKKTGGGLIYIARWTDKLGVEYYLDPEYSRRPDAIYFADSEGKARIKPDARFHVTGSAKDLAGYLQRDVGASFENAEVLLSRDFRYFGDAGKDLLTEYRAIDDLIRRAPRATIVNFTAGERIELLELKEALWTRYGEPVIGNPRTPQIV